MDLEPESSENDAKTCKNRLSGRFELYFAPTNLCRTIYYSGLTEEGISLQEASDMARDYTGPHGFDPLPSLQNLDVPGLWLLGGQDSSIPVPLTIENLDSLVADHGKDYGYIIYPNMNHGLRDADNTGQMYPVLYDALNWLEEKFRD